MAKASRVMPGDFRRVLLTSGTPGVLPILLANVMELAKQPETDLNRLCDLMRNDGALVAGIIRLSNSSFYAPVRPHSNLLSALTHIGLQEAVRVLSLSVARRLFACDLACYGIKALDNWSTAVATALVMEALAKRVGENPEDAHTVGILHTLGQVLIDKVIRDLDLSLTWDGSQLLSEWECEVVGCHYGEVGATALEYWGFPLTICEAIRSQLQPPVPKNPLSLLDLLRFSRQVLGRTGLELKKPGWTIPESDEFLRVARMTPESLYQIVRECRASFVSILDGVSLE